MQMFIQYTIMALCVGIHLELFPWVGLFPLEFYYTETNEPNIYLSSSVFIISSWSARPNIDRTQPAYKQSDEINFRWRHFRVIPRWHHFWGIVPRCHCFLRYYTPASWIFRDILKLLNVMWLLFLQLWGIINDCYCTIDVV